MSDWIWQGFFGPMAAVEAAKALVHADPRGGAWVPPEGEPPRAVDRSGTMGMFAVATRPGEPIPCPAGLVEADPALVGRMVGA